MKKNLITIIILAFTIINFILSILMVFVYMPATKKTDKLVTEICNILDLELKSDGERGKVSVSDLDYYTTEEKQVISIMDSSGNMHYASVSVTLSLDTTAKDYSTINSKLESLENVINDQVRTVVASYTYEKASSVATQEEMQTAIKEKISEYLDTDCIYDVTFGSFVVQ